MWRLVLMRARLRVAAGLLVAISSPLWLPEAPASRIWSLAALALLAPWLVLGRDLAQRRDGLREALRAAPRGGRLVLAELVPPLVVLAVAALVGTGGAVRPALALLAWAGALVALADALDRGEVSAGAAWTILWSGALLLLTAPLWAAAWFGTTTAAPWPATLVVGLHPAASALAAADLATLQDPRFYRVTLSGVVEARPLPWFWGAILFATVTALGAGLSVRAARRPTRSMG